MWDTVYQQNHPNINNKNKPARIEHRKMIFETQRIAHAATVHTNSFEIFTVWIIEQIPSEITVRFGQLQREREMFWIYKFNTLTPFGLNEALETIY